MSKQIIFVLAMVYGILPANAQQNNKELFKSSMAALQKAYTGDTGNVLSFRVSYTYTNESKPDSVLDKIGGYFRLHKTQYRYQLDSTEVIANDSVQVTLFKEEKLMYLTRTGKQTGFMQNPLALLDSSLARIKGLTIKTEEPGGNIKVSLLFPEGMEYRQLAFFINKQSGFIDSSIYVVKTEAMLEAGAGPVDHALYEQYATIKAVYYDYSRTPLNMQVFDNKPFYRREAGEVKALSPYSEYRVFVGSPGF